MSSDSNSYGPHGYKTCGYPHEKFVKTLATLEERSASQTKQLDDLSTKFDAIENRLHDRIMLVKESITSMGTEIAKEIAMLKYQGNGMGAQLAKTKDELTKDKANLDDEISVEIKDQVQAEIKRLKAEEEAKQQAAAGALLRSLFKNWKVWIAIMIAMAGGGGLWEVLNRLATMLTNLAMGGGAGH